MTAPAPYTPKPSILDRVLGKLFPTDQYGGLLDAQARQGIQHQGLLNLGMGMLADTGAGSGLFPSLGKSFQGIDVNAIADHAVKLKAYQTQLQQQTALQQAKDAIKPEPNESAYDYLGRVAKATGGMAGSPEKLSSLLDALKPPQGAAIRPRWSFQTVMENGQPVLYRINDDTGTKYRVGLGKPSGAQGGVTAQETKAAARNALVALDEADRLLARDPEADIVPVATSVARGAERIPIIGGMLSGAMDPIAQQAMRPTQQQFQRAIDQVLHNYSALLPRGGRSVQILKNLRNSFAPSAGQTDAEVRKGFATARAHLRQTLEALAEGREPTGPLPGTDAPSGAGEYDDLLK